MWGVVFKLTKHTGKKTFIGNAVWSVSFASDLSIYIGGGRVESCIVTSCRSAVKTFSLHLSKASMLSSLYTLYDLYSFEAYNNTLDHKELSMVLKLQHLPLCHCLITRASLCSPHPQQIIILTLWILTPALPYSREAQESSMNIDEWSLMSLWNLHIGLVPYIQNSLPWQWATWTLHNEGLFMRFMTAGGKSHLMHAESVQ